MSANSETLNIPISLFFSPVFFINMVKGKVRTSPSVRQTPTLDRKNVDTAVDKTHLPTHWQPYCLLLLFPRKSSGQPPFHRGGKCLLSKLITHLNRQFKCVGSTCNLNKYKLVWADNRLQMNSENYAKISNWKRRKPERTMWKANTRTARYTWCKNH